jgi:hypothetical protein
MEISDINTRIPIIPVNPIIPIQSPYFYLKWHLNDKRYRISASFRYLNKKYKLHINIIRDIAKKEYCTIEFKYLLSLIKNHKVNDLFKDIDFIDNTPSVYNFLDTNTSTSVFLINRTYENTSDDTLVFFSSTFWSLTDYIKSIEFLNEFKKSIKTNTSDNKDI